CMNSRFSYLYRSASNFKISTEVVVAGDDDGLIGQVRAALEDGERFIPPEVGLPALQHDLGWEMNRDDDHVWHPLVEIAPTDEDADADAPTLAELAASFHAASGKWDVAAAEADLFGD